MTLEKTDRKTATITQRIRNPATTYSNVAQAPNQMSKLNANPTSSTNKIPEVRKIINYTDMSTDPETSPTAKTTSNKNNTQTTFLKPYSDPFTGIQNSPTASTSSGVSKSRKIKILPRNTSKRLQATLKSNEKKLKKSTTTITPEKTFEDSSEDMLTDMA